MGDVAAFETLGLPLSASEDEIHARFRELSRTMHPDAGGSNDDMQTLTQAYHVAVGTARNRTLVPLSVVNELAELSRKYQELAAVQQQAYLDIQRNAKFEEQARKAVSGIILHHTSRTRRLRQQAALAAALTAGIGFFTNQVLPTMTDSSITLSLFGSGTPELSALPWISLFLILLAGAFGINAWMFNSAADRIENRITEVSDSLGDKTTYIAVLDQVLAEAEDACPCTRLQLQAAVEKWSGKPRQATVRPDSRPLPGFPGPYASGSRRVEMSSLVDDIGAEDFVRIFVAKGLANDLLREVRVSGLGGRTIAYMAEEDREPFITSNE